MSGKDRILVVDDENVIRELLYEVLTDEGYDVAVANGGRAALALLEESDDFVVLFTDIMMPEMDGITLVREARRRCPAIIPIVMTAYATLDSARAAVKEGAYDYVLKPFSLSEVRLAVQNALERHRLTNENARLYELSQLFDISEKITTIHAEEELLDFVLRAALEHVGASRGSVMVLTPDAKSLDLRVSVGIPEEALGSHMNVGEGISGFVALTARPLLVQDMALVPELFEKSRKLRDRSFISVPIHQHGRMDSHAHDDDDGSPQQVAAVMNVSQKRDGSQFTDSDLTILNIVANHAAAALQNVRLIRDIEEAHLSTIESMALLLEARDPYTKFHSTRVRDISIAIAKEMGLSSNDIEVLRIGAAFHDLGKVGVPDAILNKPDKLTDDEWMLIKRHPEIGHDVLAPIPFLKQGHLELVRNHHERLDGRGYPDGWSGDRIPVLVRIIAVADSYDAMASSRAYRRQRLSPEAIAVELTKCRGTGMDPNVVDIMVNMMHSGEADRLIN